MEALIMTRDGRRSKCKRAYLRRHHQLVPVAVADGGVLQLGDGSQRRQQVLDHRFGLDVRLQELHVFVEVAHVLRKSLALRLHVLNVDFLPRRLLPVVDARGHSVQEVPRACIHLAAPV